MKKLVEDTAQSTDIENIFIKDDGNKKHSKEEILQAYQNAVFKSYGINPKKINKFNDFKEYWLNKHANDKENKVPSLEYINNNIYYEDDNGKSFSVRGKSYDWQKEESERFDQIDGVVGNIQQGNVKSCWILTGLKATSLTKTGAEKIKTAIKKDKDGNYIINFEGGRSVTVSREEYLAQENKNLSTGDGEGKLFEIALKKIKPDHNINWGHSEIMTEALTGKESTKYELASLSPEQKKYKLHELAEKQRQGNTIITSGSSTFANTNELHGYTVRINPDKTVTLLNPWDTAKPTTISYDEFLTKFSKLYVADLDS